MRPTLLLTLCVFPAVTPAAAGVLRVPAEHATPQAAIDVAAAGDRVLVAAGEYVLDRPLTFRGRDIMVVAESGPANTILRMADQPADADAASVVVFELGESAACVLEGFTITGGGGHRSYLGIAGGGIFISASGPSIRGCWIVGNEARDYSGGVHCQAPVDYGRGSSPRLEDCTISDNASVWAGGVFCDGASRAELAGCTVTGNLATRGGGVYARTDSRVRLDRCTVAGNSADFAGGIYDSGYVDIRNSIVWDNAGGSFKELSTLASIAYSCVEGLPARALESFDADPLFAGWGLASAVHVDSSRSGPGDGSPGRPFTALGEALRYDYALGAGSPCIGAAEDGGDIGAANGSGGEPGLKSRLVHLAAGEYPIAGGTLAHRVSIEGRGLEATVVRGTLSGLRGSATLKGLTVAGGRFGGVALHGRESPQISNAAIRDNRAAEGAGLYCGRRSSPRLSSCLLTGNWAGSRGGAVYCAAGAVVAMDHVTLIGNGAPEGGAIYLTAGAGAKVSSSIVWGNMGGAAEEAGALMEAGHSCVEGPEAPTGPGNINVDPLFCGWAGAAEVFVDPSAAPGGDGSAARPFTEIERALAGYSLALQASSPGRGGGGSDMGAFPGSCDGEHPTRTIHLSGGRYASATLRLFWPARLLGDPAPEAPETILDGGLRDLRSGVGLARLTFAGGEVTVAPGEEPELTDCVITAGRGLYIGFGAAPRLARCRIEHNLGDGRAAVRCSAGSMARFEHCVLAGNGSARDPGGAIFCAPESAPWFDHCTIAGNAAPAGGGLYCRTGAAPLVTNSILWDNTGGSLFVEEGGAPSVRHSCVEGAAWPGEGNLELDPRFCGWESAVAHVDSARARPGEEGDGSPAKPFRELAAALRGYALSLADGSPCRGAAEGGGDMGASAPACEREPLARRRVLIAPGAYAIEAATLAHRASLEGASRERTVVRGTVLGLRSGEEVAELTLRAEGPSSFERPAVLVSAGEAPAVRRSTITGGNREDGVTVSSGSLTLDDCVVAGKRLGVVCRGSSSLSISGSTFTDNETAITVQGTSRLEIRKSVLDGNLLGLQATGGATIEAAGCRLANQRSFGTSCAGSTSLALTNCSVIQNGGTAVMLFNDARAILTNSTLSSNAGGVAALADSRAAVLNCIVWGNRGWDLRASSSARVDAGHSCFAAADGVAPGTGNVDGDPLFRAPAAGDYRLRPGSPAVDAGRSEGAPSDDQDGNARPCGLGVDMGAFELCDVPPAVLFQRGDWNGDGRLNVTDAIALLFHLFAGRAASSCRETGDLDDTGTLDLTDAIHLLRYLFQSGGPPAAPYPACGLDPSADPLDCEAFPACG